MKCSCQRKITRIIARQYYNTALIGGGIATDVVGWELTLQGHCSNGCGPVNLGSARSIQEVQTRYPNISIEEKANAAY